MMDWNKKVIRATLEGAGDFPGVQLQFLLMRLEQYPEALPAIADAVRDMGNWYLDQADALENEKQRRNGADIVGFEPSAKK